MTSQKNTSNRHKGDQGERLACMLLQQQGYSIITTNYHSRFGEIDIIARQGSELVFVEVKLRQSTYFGTPEESFTKTKQSRLFKTIWYYLNATNQNTTSTLWRCDLLTLQLNRQQQLISHQLYHNVLEG